MIDHRTDPRLLPPYQQLGPLTDKCESCAIALVLHWIHQFGHWAPGVLYGHSRAFLTWLAAHYISNPGNSFNDIIYGLIATGTVSEWEYSTTPDHSNDKTPPKGTIAAATKVVGGVAEISVPKDIPIFLEQRPVIARLPWYESFKKPGKGGIVRSVGNEQWNYHYVAIVGLVEKNGKPHYVISPHRGTDYGDGGYCYANKLWVERMGDDPKFYDLIPY